MKLATHNGIFHTDDVFAIAVLKELFPDAELIRSRDETILDSADIVVDVGKVFDPVKQRFDHHQQQAGQRPNSIIYSGLGLIWQAYGLPFCDNNEALWQRIDQQFIQHIDAHDNGQKTYQVDATGVEPFLIDDVIQLYNPSPTDKAEANSHDTRFIEAVEFARFILKRLKKIHLETLEGEEAFLGLYETTSDRHYVVLDNYLPFKQLLKNMPELLYVVYPYETGTSWMVEAVPRESGSFESRKPHPISWHGKSVPELRELTGVQDVVFCHNTGFIAGAKSKEGALALLQKSFAA